MAKRTKNIQPLIGVVDLFSGIGGLTCGIRQAGLNVIAGIDTEAACQYAYESNNKPARFIKQSVEDLTGDDLNELFGSHRYKVLVGCAPCQAFSKYTNLSIKEKKRKWSLLHHFARLIEESSPDVVSMENVRELEDYDVFDEFVDRVRRHYEHVSYSVVNCLDYGVPQTRKRLVLFASKLGPISIVPPFVSPSEYRTVEATIGHLPPLVAGGQDEHDPMHKACRLEPLNYKRIQASRPGGTWRDWPAHLRADCHKAESGETYPSVYGRMEADKPAPTMTTQFFGYGNGRFGHPVQDRAISLREGALIQSFPHNYKFAPKGHPLPYAATGRMIGNAVPVRLGEAIGLTILEHIKSSHQ